MTVACMEYGQQLEYYEEIPKKPRIALEQYDETTQKLKNSSQNSMKKEDELLL